MTEKRVFVAYGSRLGSTRQIAERIGARLEASGLAVTLAAVDRSGELPDAEAFVVGSGVYAQHWMKAAAALVRRNRSVLSTHPVWLFSSGPMGRWAGAPNPIEPREISAFRRAIHIRGHRTFAGAIDHAALAGGDLSAIERFVTRRFMPQGDFRNWAEIEAWAEDIARDLRR